MGQMGQNNIYNNNNDLLNNKAGQSLGQNAGQRDSLKQQALSKLSLSHRLSHGLSHPGTTEKRVNKDDTSFCPAVPPVPPAKNLNGTEKRLYEIVQIFNANNRTLAEYKHLAIEGDKICRQLSPETVEAIFSEVAGPATKKTN